MNDNNNGLMASTGTKQTAPIMDEFRRILAPRSGPDASLKERLERLTSEQRNTVLRTAELVQLAMRMNVSVGDQSMGYLDLVRSMYGNLPNDIADLVAAVLDDTNPLKFVPKPKPKRSASEIAAQFYNEDSYPLEPSKPEASQQRGFDDILQTTFEGPQQEAVSPQPNNDDFLARLTQSESSGNSQAEITIEDGRRFVGSLQFGEARLADYKKATGKTFTQDAFKADEALQDEVAQWHFKDIDKAIDALGDAAKGYDRDGLRSVAHLGGSSGMKRFVRSGGDYNPSDELGTSLQDYYDKFSSST